MVHKLGYGNWDELKAAFRTSPLFRFDWFVKSRTTQELARRCDTLIRLVERENQEFDERERQARKEKKLAKVDQLAINLMRLFLSCMWTALSFAVVGIDKLNDLYFKISAEYDSIKTWSGKASY